MATYKLGPGTQFGAKPPAFRHPLICEVCLEALGNVESVASHAGLSALLTISLWPQMKFAIERHEIVCMSAVNA